jgi:hypothetical protein
VIVHDLDVFSAAFHPAEVHTELIFDANAVLAGSTAFERFEPIARRHPQVVQPSCDF